MRSTREPSEESYFVQFFYPGKERRIVGCILVSRQNEKIVLTKKLIPAERKRERKLVAANEEILKP